MNAAESPGVSRSRVQGLLQEVHKLQTSRAYRDSRGSFYAEGVRNFVHAVEAGLVPSTIIFSEKLLIVPIARMAIRRCRRMGIEAVAVSPEEFRRFPCGERASGVAFIAPQRWEKFGACEPTPAAAGRPATPSETSRFWLALESVRSPGNLGTLLRTAEAAGGAGTILVGPESDPYDPAVVRGSMGSIYRQPLLRASQRKFHEWARLGGLQVVGATPDGQVPLHEFRFRPSTVLMLGDERDGLSERQRRMCTDFVRIPMVGKTDSINVAVAGGLLMYEAIRGVPPITPHP